MIYADTILENKFNSLCKSELEIMQEYYENEISMLNATIEYRGVLVSESSELETLHEGFISTIANKIKELVKKFLDWLKKLWDSFMGLFKKNVADKEKTIKEAEQKVKEADRISNSPEEAASKKEEAIKLLVKKKSSNNSNSSSTNKSYKYCIINKFAVREVLNMKGLYMIEDFFEYMFEDLDISSNDKDREKYIRNLERTKERYPAISVEDAWKDYYEHQIHTIHATPEKIIEYINQNLEEYKACAKTAESDKIAAEKLAKRIEKETNNLPKDFRQENLNRLFNMVNSTIAYMQQLVNNEARFLPKLKSVIYLTEVED